MIGSLEVKMKASVPGHNGSQRHFSQAGSLRHIEMLMPKLLLLFLFSGWLIVGVCPAADPPITCVAFAPDAKSVVACSQGGVAVYSWPDLTPHSTLKTSSPNIHDLAFSPGGDRLAVAGGTPAEDGTVEILSWPEGESLGLLNGHSDSVMDVCWIDQTTLASASLDHNVMIWNIENGKIIRTLKGHSRGVTALDYLGGQGILVSAGIDQSLRVWDLKSGELVRSLAIHIKPVNSVLLRPANEGLPMIAWQVMTEAFGFGNRRSAAWCDLLGCRPRPATSVGCPTGLGSSPAATTVTST